MALPSDPWFDEYNLERVRAAETLLVGRRTYQQLRAFRVPLAEDPSASSLQREIGRFQRDVPTVVISDGLGECDMAAHPATATVVRRDEAPAKMERLRAGDGGDIRVFGSRTTWASCSPRGSSTSCS